MSSKEKERLESMLVATEGQQPPEPPRMPALAPTASNPFAGMTRTVVGDTGDRKLTDATRAAMAEGKAAAAARAPAPEPEAEEARLERTAMRAQYEQLRQNLGIPKLEDEIREIRRLILSGAHRR